MTPRTLAIIWLAVGVAVWCGVLDVHVSQGAREYLQREAEFALGRSPQPSMPWIMARAAHEGIVSGTIWGVSIASCGWLTIVLRHNRGTRQAATS